MATRDRTVLFVQYRNSFGKNQNRQEDDDILLPKTTIEVQPVWMDAVNECEEVLGGIDGQLQQLQQLQKRSALTSFDDTNDKQIERVTSQITSAISTASTKIKRLASNEIVVKNAQVGLASKLATLSQQFRSLQNQHLAQMTAREGKMQPSLVVDAGESGFQMDFSQQQLLQITSQNTAITEREQQIEAVAKSIMQLSEIFRDLQTLVVDQGTILDRIDYNIELVRASVEPAFQELQKAEEYQKNSKTRYCIILLGVMIVILLIIVMFKKKK